MIDQDKRLAEVARARHVHATFHPLKGDAYMLLPNVPMHAFFDPKFTRRILQPTSWINEDIVEVGWVAHNALTNAGVLSIADFLEKKAVKQARVMPGQDGRPQLSLEQIVFMRGMTVRAAALTLDMLQAVGHRVESVPGSWTPPAEDSSPSPVLNALGIAA